MYLFWFVHQLKPRRGVYAPLSLSQGYLSSVCTQKCKSKHLPSAACLSSQVPLFPSSMLPRIILLTVRCYFLLLFLHHFQTGRYGHWVFVFLIYVNICEEDPLLPEGWLCWLFLCLKPLTWRSLESWSVTSVLYAWIFGAVLLPSYFSA